MDVTEELTCSICQGPFRCPVTTGCGHSFCSECLQDHWGRQTCPSCPLCRHPYPERPELSKSVALSRICEWLQTVGSKAPPDDLCPLPGSQPQEMRALADDLCSIEDEEIRGSVRKELQLVESRLRAAWEAEAALTERADSLRESMWRARVQLGRALGEASRRMEGAVAEEGDRLEQSRAKLRERWTELSALIPQQGAALLQGWQRLEPCPDGLLLPAGQTDVCAALTALQQVVTTAAEQLQAQLCGSSTQAADQADQTQDLDGQTPRTDTQTPRPEAQTAGPDVQTLGVDNAHASNILPPATSTDTVRGVEAPSGNVDPTPVTAAPSSPLPGPSTEMVTREQLLQSWTAVSFDESTASGELRVSEQGALASNVWPESQERAGGRGRFQRLCQVLGLPGLEGRHYWEVAVSGQPVMVGLAHSGMDRQRRDNASLLGRNPSSWCLEVSQGKAVAWHDKQPGGTLQAPHPHIGLLLDLPQHTLAFYSLGPAPALLHRFSGPFLPTLFPAFYINRKASVRILPRNWVTGKLV